MDHPPDTASTEPRTVAVLQSNLLAAFDETVPDNRVDVIVSYRDPMGSELGGAQRRRVNQVFQQRLLAAHAAGFAPARQFLHVPAIAGSVTRQELERLRQDPAVEYVQLDGTGQGGLKESVPAIGADIVHNMYGLTGKGVRVAVLDTGIATSHPDFQGSIMEQHCFTQFACPPAAERESTSAEDDHGHGSNVSGIVGSRGKVAPTGFAPGAELVSVKINDSNDSGRVSDWVAGLDWIFDNLDTLKVKVINMSICSTVMYADATACDAEEPAMARAVKNLVDAGVVLFAASGNLGSTTTMSSPACNTGVIAVAATYDSDVGSQPPNGQTYRQAFGASVANCGDRTTAFDQITCFSNTPPRIDLAAPGAPMLSDGLRGMTSTYRGTSQASPAAAGVAALMLECNPSLTPAQIQDAMIRTGVPRLDAKTMRMIPSLRADAAVKAACDQLAAGAAAAGSGGTPTGPAAGSGAVAPGAAAGAAGVFVAAAGSGAAGSATPAAAAAGVAAPQPGVPQPTGSTQSSLGVAGASGSRPVTPPTAAGTNATLAPAALPSNSPSAEANDGCGCSSVGARRTPQVEVGWLVVSGVLGVGLRRRLQRRLA